MVKGSMMGAILLANPNALESQSRVVFLGVIAVAEFERTPQNADRVVIGFFTPRHVVGDFDER